MDSKISSNISSIYKKTCKSIDEGMFELKMEYQEMVKCIQFITLIDTCTEITPSDFKANHQIKDLYSDYVFFHLGVKNYSIDDKKLNVILTEEIEDLQSICKDKIFNCFKYRYKRSICKEECTKKIYDIYVYSYVTRTREVFRCNGAGQDQGSRVILVICYLYIIFIKLYLF